MKLLNKNKSPLIRDVHQLYQGWCKFSGYKPLGRNKFNAKLRSNGFTVETGNNNKTVLRGYMLPMDSNCNPIETFELWRVHDKNGETLMHRYENNNHINEGLSGQEAENFMEKFMLMNA